MEGMDKKKHILCGGVSSKDGNTHTLLFGVSCVCVCVTGLMDIVAEVWGQYPHPDDVK